jgi:RNA polymerase sigma-70 factor (ECF subfamily)
VGYQCTVGDLAPDAIAPEDLVSDVLIRAWQERHRRPAGLGMRPWLIGLHYRGLESFVRRQAGFLDLADMSLEGRPAAPVYDDD